MLDIETKELYLNYLRIWDDVDLERFSDAEKKSILIANSDIRKIIMWWILLLKQRDTQTVLLEISKYSPNDEFFLAEKYRLQACLEIYRRNIEGSIIASLEAIRLHKKFQYHSLLLFCYQLIIGNYQHLKHFQLANFYCALSKQFCTTVREFSSLHRAYAFSHLEMGNYHLAHEHMLEDLKNLKAKDHPSSSLTYSFLVETSFLIGDWQGALTFLKKGALIKSSLLKEMALLDYRLLLNLMDKSKRIQSQGVASRIKGHFHSKQRYDVLCALESGDDTTARLKWATLVSAFPHNYGDDFILKGQRISSSIFGTKLKMLLEQHSRIDPLSLIKELSMKQDSIPARVIKVLCFNQSSRLRKEEIIEKVWKVPYSPVYDDRLYKVIERIKKKKTTFTIANYNNSYSIELLN